MSDAIRPEPRSRAILPPKSLAALLAAVVAVVVIAILSWRSLTARAEASESVRHSMETRQALYQVLNAIEDAETGQRGYLLTGDARYLEPYDAAQVTVPASLRELRALIAGDETQQRRMTELEAATDGKLEELGRTVEARRAGSGDAAIAMVKTGRGKMLMDQARQTIGAMLDQDVREIDVETAAADASVRWSTYMTLGGATVLFAMMLLLGLLASRDFRRVEAEGWVRRVQVALGRTLQGDHRLDSLGEKVLATLTANAGAQVGAVYVNDGDRLRRVAGHALAREDEARTIELGAGVIGQAAKDQAIVHLRDVPADHLRLSSAVGSSAAREVMIVPAAIDGALQAVTELGFLHAVDPAEREVLARVAESIAVAVRSARDRVRLEELLEETQRQAEELQAQQEELRVSNEELEQQSRVLQVSQTQLENQQSELEQINAQLEEQTQSLERQRDELARAGSELQRANEYKSQFLANMSHELRTPLNSSLILAKLLADNRGGNLTAEQTEFARTIYTSGNDLLTLINDILDLSKIEAGMLDLRPEPVVLARLADDLLRTFQPLADQRSLALAVRVDDSAPPSIDTDATRLMQILKNLLANAIKFTERGGVTVEIGAADGGLRFAVTDTGIGISADQHELIFDAFRQADGASTRKFGGTGLGLSISRDLARLLGGDLIVDSTAGRGSTFTLTLPPSIVAHTEIVAPPPRPAARRRSTETLAAQVPGPAPFADDRDRVRPDSRVLLLIEDDVAFARVLHDLAHELEFLAVVAVTAEDGLALARRHPPSAIVLDIGLPDRSGLAVLDSLKRDPRTRHIPVHIVSVTDYSRTALAMGAVGYALKPVERARLVDAIRALESKFTQTLRRVLIVEDDPQLRASTAKLLAADDVETVTAGTTAEALDLLRSRTFDCMVLDLSLPDRSGLELLEEMSRGEHGFPPVIVYTGRTLSTDQVHELERFSHSIIIKGARSPERLLDEVTLFLHQVEARMPAERQRMLRDARDREAVFEGRRILIVEDDVRNVFALSSVLEPKGATVEIARNGREALEKLARQPAVDLVLMDIMMPEMDGLEATRRLRAQPQFAKLPIIALTAKAMIDDREKCLEAGANDYIAKPLDVDKLLSLARVWIRK